MAHFIKDLDGFFFMKKGATMYSEDVVDSADAKALTEQANSVCGS